MISARAPQLRVAAAALVTIRSSLAEHIAASNKNVEPEWKNLIASHASTQLEQRVLASTASSVQIENGIRLEAAKTAGSLSGGLSITRAAGPTEYGANRAKRKTYRRRSRKGRVHTVTRRTAVQFRDFNKTGHVFGPALRAIVPKIEEAWAEAFEVTVADAVNGKP